MFKNNISQMRAKRGKRGVSQSHLARRIKISRAYMSKLEKGTQKPSAVIMFKLAEYFECPIEDIFKYIPNC